MVDDTGPQNDGQEPNESEVDRIDREMRKLSEGARELLGEHEAALEALMVEVSVERDAISRLKRAIAATELPQIRAPRTPHGASGKPKKHSSEETRQLVMKVLTEHPNGLATKQIADLAGKHVSTIQYGITDLRGADRIRIARREVLEDGGPPANIYKVM